MTDTTAQLAAARIREALEGCEATRGADKPYEVYESFRDMLAKSCHQGAMRALLAERDELAKDAARYRWLMEHCGFEIDGRAIELRLVFDTRPDYFYQLEPAIDAALTNKD